MKLRRMAGLTAAALVVDAITYAALIRPRLISWGATREEAAKVLPGDDRVPEPRYMATHAITIDAPAAGVWPWLVQIGQGRGGFYSYDWMENLAGLDIHSADEIIPELQGLKAGDRIYLAPDDSRQSFYLEVASLEPEKSLVLVTPGSPQECLESGLPWATWVFELEDAGMGRTRLIARMRAGFRPCVSGYMVNKFWLEPVHFMMERKMLLGIKKRAERMAYAGGEMAASGSEQGLTEAQPEAGLEAA